jgi:hypothetical protein
VKESIAAIASQRIGECVELKIGLFHFLFQVGVKPLKCSKKLVGILIQRASLTLEDLVGESSFTLGRLPSTIRSPLSVSRQFLNERREFRGDPFLVLLLSLRCPANYQLLGQPSEPTPRNSQRYS